MFIREISHFDRISQKTYSTFKLVESFRSEKGPRQRTLLNLGSHFELPKEQWKNLAARIDQIVTGQQTITPYLQEIEHFANRYSKQLLKKQAEIIPHGSSVASKEQPEFHEIDILSLKHSDVRTVGTEHLLLSMLKELELDKKLEEIGFNQEQVQLAIGSIINRAASPSSERKTHDWLENQSALGDLLGFDFGKTSLYKLYNISDLLLNAKKPLEEHLAQKEKNLFKREDTIILYDLTNTYFEGSAKQNPKAMFGRSKEKRSDCRLVTMGLTLNGDGFPKKSDFFAGNASESKTLSTMIESMRDKDLPTQPIIIMDAGIATEENIIWLIENNFEYLVVSRKAKSAMPEGVETQVVKEKKDHIVEVAMIPVENHYYRVGSSDLELFSELKVPVEMIDKLKTLEGEIFQKESLFISALKNIFDKEQLKVYRDLLLATAKKSYSEQELYCFSEARSEKEQSMKTRVQLHLEEDLSYLNSGLLKKGRVKNYDKITEKIGRLKEKYKGISSFYMIDVQKEEKGENASAITWTLKEEKVKDRFSGVYCLRTSVKNMDAKSLWKTYTMLTEVEAAFRCMKSELGLRPVHHQREDRVDGHLFITLLAFHLIHCIRFQLKQHGIHESWTTIRDRLVTQVRLTSSLKRKDGKMIHVRKSSEPNIFQEKIYKALGISLNPGQIEKTILG